MPRQWPVPATKRTLHLIGDLHALTNANLNFKRRRDLTATDILHPMVPKPVARVQVGDITDNGRGDEDQIARDWIASLPNVPFYTAVGNHDLRDYTALTERTPAEWAVAYGMPGQNYTLDLGFVKLIFVGPDGISGYTGITLTNSTLNWLNNELATANKECFVVGHAPLYNTVIGDQTQVWSSAEAAMHMHPDSDIRTILNAHWTAKAWISGHTHSPVDASGFMKVEPLANRSILSINCSAIMYVGRSYDMFDPLRTFYLTHTGTHAEIRMRNHGAGIWDSFPGVGRVLSLPIPS